MVVLVVLLLLLPFLKSNQRLSNGLTLPTASATAHLGTLSIYGLAGLAKHSYEPLDRGQHIEGRWQGGTVLEVAHPELGACKLPLRVRVLLQEAEAEAGAKSAKPKSKSLLTQQSTHINHGVGVGHHGNQQIE